jgi:hypothetical protein
MHSGNSFSKQPSAIPSAALFVYFTISGCKDQNNFTPLTLPTGPLLRYPLNKSALFKGRIRESNTPACCSASGPGLRGRGPGEL